MNYIALICDEKYVLPTRVAIQSIIENAKTEYTVLVCTFELSQESVDVLEKQTSKLVNIKVIRVNQDIFADRLGGVIQKTHVTPAALLKFELPNIFSNIDKLLYIDSDIIIKQDINELFEIDIENHYIAATFEFLKYWEQVKYVFKPFREKGPYINSGVILMNLKKMRMDRVTDKLWEYKLSGKCKTTSMDQETINSVCGKSMINLTNLYNFNPAFNSPENLRPFKYVYGIDYSTMDCFLNDVKIIHYVGKNDKPWVYSDARLGNYWMKYYYLLSNPKQQLALKENAISSNNLFKRLILQLKEHGLLGVIHYILYKIGIRL